MLFDGKLDEGGRFHVCGSLQSFSGWLLRVQAKSGGKSRSIPAKRKRKLSPRRRNLQVIDVVSSHNHLLVVSFVDYLNCFYFCFTQKHKND